MPEVLAAIDISLVPLRRHDLFRGAIPSKLFEAMGAGVPVVVGIDGEARSLVELSGGGLVVEPESPNELARAVLLLYRDPILRNSLSVRGRKYIHRFYNRAQISQELQNSLLKIISAQTETPETDLESSEDIEIVGGNFNK